MKVHLSGGEHQALDVVRCGGRAVATERISAAVVPERQAGAAEKEEKEVDDTPLSLVSSCPSRMETNSASPKT